MLNWIKNRIMKKEQPKMAKIKQEQEPEEEEEKRIDVPRLREEIKSLAHKISFLKGRVRDPDLNMALSYKWNKLPPDEKANINKKCLEHESACFKLWQIKRRFTKLVTLRSLMRGRIHFSPNTNLDKLGLSSLDLDDLWDWVEDEKEEFEK